MKNLPETIRTCFLVRSLLALSLAALVGAGCGGGARGRMQSQMTPPGGATSPSTVSEINNSLAAAALQAPASIADYRLSPEDLLQITLFNVAETEVGVTPRRMEVRVSQQGAIVLPLLGEMTVMGLTTSALEQVLGQGYEKYLHNPQVGVLVKEYRGQRISVSGAVQRPGVFELTGPKTLVDLLSMAGGVSDKAGSQVHLYRQGPEGRQTYVIDLLALSRNGELMNQAVYGGDVINVPQSGMFFVDGAVHKPGSYPLGRSYTLTRALALAGGADFELGKTSEITIFRRRDATEFDRIPVNLVEIRSGNATDPEIEADDVIVVPVSTPKYLVRRFLGSIGLGGVPVGY